MLALLISGLYRSVLRHAGSELLVLLLRSVLLGAGLFALMELDAGRISDSALNNCDERIICIFRFIVDPPDDSLGGTDACG